jgi:hypothetical protein
MTFKTFFFTFLFSTLVIAGPAGVTVAFYDADKNIFVLPSADIIYGEKCKNETIAPSSIEKCFGTKDWPNKNTPFIPLSTFKAALNSIKRKSTSWEANIKELEGLILVKNDEIKPFNSKIAAYKKSIAEIDSRIQFIEMRLKDSTLPEEVKENLKKEHENLHQSKHYDQHEISELEYKIKNKNNIISKYEKEITLNKKRISSEDQFNSYINKEEQNLFKGIAIRNISHTEPFGSLLMTLFSSPSLTMEWEGPEPEVVNESEIHKVNNFMYKKVSLKRIALNSAMAPGLLKIGVQDSYWESTSKSDTVILTAEMIKKGFIEEAHLPAVFKEKNFRLWSGSRSQKAIIVGNRVGLINMTDKEVFIQKILGTSKIEDKKITATIPMMESFPEIGAASLFSDNAWGYVKVSGRYNNGGIKFCPDSLFFPAAIEDSKTSAYYRELNEEKLLFTGFYSATYLTSYDKNNCNYKGNISHSYQDTLLIDGVKFYKKP